MLKIKLEDDDANCQIDFAKKEPKGTMELIIA